MTARTAGARGRSRLVALALAVAGALGLSAALAGGQTLALEKLEVGLAGIGPGKAGLWTAKEAGLFAQEGLDVEFTVFASGTEAVQVLVAGHLPVVAVSAPPVINAVRGGADLVWVAELLGTMPYTVFVAPGIAGPADLRGKRMGVSKFGSSSDVATRLALLRLGLEPGRDVTVLQLGGQSTRFAALQAGSIDGTVVSPPSTLVARKLGFKALVDLGDLGLRYPHDGIAVPRTVLQSRPATLRRFLRALVLGIHRFKTERTDGIRALRRYLATDDAEVLDEAYSAFARLIPAKPAVSLESLRTVPELQAARRGGPFRPEEIVDARFVAELDGLVEQLYRK